MTTQGLDCCAVAELIDLSDHTSPEKAMLGFCRDYTDYQGKVDDVPAFIVFTGVVRFKSDKRSKVTYGPEFAKLIKAKHLGTVVESPARVNRCNHPDHTVKVWVWCPSIKGLNTWYSANKGKVKAKRAPKAYDYGAADNEDYYDPGW